MIANTKYISSWKSKGLSESNCLLIDYLGNKIILKFDGTILRKPKISYAHRKTVNIYIVYKLGASSCHSGDPALKNCFFWCSYFD